MPQETKSQKRKRWTPVWVACLLLIGVAAWTSTLLPQPAAKSEHEAGVEKREAVPYLGVWEGQLARFDGVNDTPEEVYEVRISSLPESEQKRLESGITWESEEAFAQLIEAYTG